MTAKNLLFQSEAREKVLKGVTALAGAVRIHPWTQIEIRADWAEVGTAPRLQ